MLFMEELILFLFNLICHISRSLSQIISDLGSFNLGTGVSLWTSIDQMHHLKSSLHKFTEAIFLILGELSLPVLIFLGAS